MVKLKALYDEDLVRWSEQQAAALRRAKSMPPAAAGVSNLPLDWENLAEEIESLGKNAIRWGRFSEIGFRKNLADPSRRAGPHTGSTSQTTVSRYSPSSISRLVGTT
jgi:Domain of unknown function DUF29